MMSKAGANPFDQELRIQFLTHVLGLMKQATDLKMEGQYWRALEHLETITSFIIFRDNIGRESGEKLLDAIEALRIDTYRYVLNKWPASHTKETRLEHVRNLKAMKIFNPTLRFIQDELDRMKYYSFLQIGGVVPTATLSKDKETPDEIPLPERLSEEI